MTQSQPIANIALERMKSGQVALGMIVRAVRSGEIAMIAGATDHDFIFIDAQHALFGLETIGQMTLAALGCGVTPMVRVRRFDDADIPRLLDAGVMGIVVPDVNTAAQAEQVVAAAKFPPLGRRSIGGPSPVFGLRAVPPAENMRVLNNSTMVVCMIETREAVTNVERIAGVSGVDVLHIGCNDLLVDMGKPGEFESRELVDGISRVIAAGKAHGVQIGLGGDKDIGRQKAWIEKGVRFITTQSDVAMLTAEAARRTAELRAISSTA
jgi:2-keto-3-deoxy-L-rhamnonate aldolase RhmA